MAASKPSTASPVCGIRISLVSDVHLEISSLGGGTPVFPLGPVPSSSSPTDSTVPHVMCLLGDIGDPSSGEYEEYLRQLSQRYTHVLVVAGNHEFYRKTYEGTKVLLQTVCRKFPNVTFMDCTSVVIGGVRFAGATLWTNVPTKYQSQLQNCMNDYVRISMASGRKLTVSDTNAFHKAEREWMEAEIRSSREPLVLLSHSVPVMSLPCDTDESIANDPVVKTGFCTDLTKMMKKPVKLWLFGHSHVSCDLCVNSVRLVSNQYGYDYEVKRGLTGYSPNIILSLP